MLPTAKKLFHVTRLENNGGWIFFLQIIWVPFRIPKCNDILHSYVFMLQQSLFSRRWKSSFLFPLGEIFCTRPHGWTITRGPPPRIMPPFYLELFFAPSHQLGPGVITASKRLLSDDDWYMLLSLSLSPVQSHTHSLPLSIFRYLTWNLANHWVQNHWRVVGVEIIDHVAGDDTTLQSASEFRNFSNNHLSTAVRL